MGVHMGRQSQRKVYYIISIVFFLWQTRPHSPIWQASDSYRTMKQDGSIHLFGSNQGQLIMKRDCVYVIYSGSTE